MASHGVVSTGVATPESFGLDNPETTPLSIPTNPATPPPRGGPTTMLETQPTPAASSTDSATCGEQRKTQFADLMKTAIVGPIGCLVKARKKHRQSDSLCRGFLTGEEQRKRATCPDCHRFWKSSDDFAPSPLHWAKAGLSLERNTE